MRNTSLFNAKLYRADLGAPIVENVDSEGMETSTPGMPIVKSLQSGSFYLYKLFEELRPRYVVLYDVEMSVVRQLEVFQASHPDFKVNNLCPLSKRSFDVAINNG